MKIGCTFPSLIEKIKNGCELDAGEASKAVINMKLSKNQIEELAHIIDDGKEIHNNESAAYALSFLGIENGNAALGILINILNSTSFSEVVRGQAAEGIGLTKPDRRNKLRKIAEKSIIKNLCDPSPLVRFWCCYAIGAWRLRRGLNALYQIKKNDHLVCPGWWYVSEEAEDAIEWINGREGKDRIPVARRNNTEPDLELGLTKQRHYG